MKLENGDDYNIDAQIEDLNNIFAYENANFMHAKPERATGLS